MKIRLGSKVTAIAGTGGAYPASGISVIDASLRIKDSIVIANGGNGFGIELSTDDAQMTVSGSNQVTAQGSHGAG